MTEQPGERINRELASSAISAMGQNNQEWNRCDSYRPSSNGWYVVILCENPWLAQELGESFWSGDDGWNERDAMWFVDFPFSSKTEAKIWADANCIMMGMYD